MRFVPSWKLSIALAAVALLAAFAAWPGVITRDAEATVDSLAANANLGDDGSTITITVQGDPDAGNMVLTTNSD